MGRRSTIAILILIITGLLLLGSGPAFAAGPPGPGKTPLEKARKDLEKKLLAQPEIAGIGHSEDEGVIVVLLETNQAKGKVPDSFGGFKVRKEVTGKFKAVATMTEEAVVPALLKPGAATSISRTGVVRPLLGGVSLSAYVPQASVIYAGTLGMVTYDNKILTNAHVIAWHPDTSDNLAIGTEVLQPGSLDGGLNIANKVGALAASIPVIFNNPAALNYADAAIATIDPSIGASPGWEFGERGNYKVSGTTTVNARDQVRKSGRTSKVTTNSVRYTGFLVSVSYGPSKIAYFQDQILVRQPFIKSGDSGSVVDKGGKMAGLAFAASNVYAIVSPAQYIVQPLGISVAP